MTQKCNKKQYRKQKHGGILKMKNLGKQMGSAGASITNMDSHVCRGNTTKS